MGLPTIPKPPGGLSGPAGGPPDLSPACGMASRPLLTLWMGLPTPSSPLGGTRDFSCPSWTSGWVFRPLPTLWMGLPTPTGHAEVPPDLSRSSRQTSRTLLDLCQDHTTLPALQVGLPTPPRPLGGTPSPPVGPPVPFRTSGWAGQPVPDLQEGLPDLWVVLPTAYRHRVGLPTCPGLPDRPPDSSQPCRRTFQPLLVIQEGFLTPPGPPGGPPNILRASGWASRPLPALRIGLQTPPVPPGGTPDTSRPSTKTSRLLLDLRVDLPTPLCTAGEPTYLSWSSGRDVQPPGLPGGPPNPFRTS